MKSLTIFNGSSSFQIFGYNFLEEGGVLFVFSFRSFSARFPFFSLFFTCFFFSVFHVFYCVLFLVFSEISCGLAVFGTRVDPSRALENRLYAPFPASLIKDENTVCDICIKLTYINYLDFPCELDQLMQRFLNI